jgi:phosphomevalonate kinase
MASTSTDPAVSAADGLQGLSLSPAAPKVENPSARPSGFTLPDDAVCVSAPGKVLMAGGYLVLERQHEGLVLATSGRFYCVAAGSQSAASSSAADPKSATITISASQFPAECSWSYRVNLVTCSAPVKSIPDDTPWPESLAYLDLEQTNPGNGKNKFVEIALAKTLQLALETIAGGEEYKGDNEKAGLELLRRMRGSGGGMEAFVMADNDFYSQREQVS